MPGIVLPVASNLSQTEVVLPKKTFKRLVEMDVDEWELLRNVMFDYTQNVWEWHESPLSAVRDVEAVGKKLGFTLGLRVSLEEVDNLPPSETNTLPS